MYSRREDLMTEPLFFDASLQMEKVAYDVRLDEDPDEWPVAVVRESYKQLPFLKSYETEVEFDKMDSARGFAVGKMLIWPARMDKHAAADNKQLVTVPVIVRNREMSPLDVYTHSGHMQPMDQDKVASLLFRPQSLEGKAPMNQFMGTNLNGQLTPPNTDHQYNAGGLNKHSSVRFTADVLNSLDSGQASDLALKISGDLGLRQSFNSTPQLRSYLTEMTESKVKTASDKRIYRQGHTKNTVVQLRESGKGYIAKTANHNCFAPAEELISRFQAQEILSEEGMGRLLQDGMITLTTQGVFEGAPTVKTAQQANRFGVYNVRSAGKEQEGLIIPKVVDFDGRDLGMQLFVGDTSHSMQEKVAGVFREDHVLSSDPPSGLGVFVYQEGPYAVATEPVRIESIVKIAGSTTLVGTRMATGGSLKMSVVPGLQKIAMIGNEVALPATVRFLSLPGKTEKVASTVDDVHLFEHQKVAGAHSVELISDGTFYSIRGANSDPAFKGEILDKNDTEFALCALGLTGAQAQGVMKTASVRKNVVIAQTRLVVPEGDRFLTEMRKTASAVKDATPLAVELYKEVALLTSPPAQELWKQASVIVAKETTDAILSLGFVTPENASLYVNYLPELEKVSGQLAELLVASRLGMDDVREAAAKNAMTQVNAVVRGLETLRERIQ